MKHTVLGAGGVGGLVGGGLARAGQEVVLVMTPGSLSAYGGRLHVESRVLGTFEVPVPAVLRLDGPVDVLWVTVKATQLEPALSLAPPAAAGAAIVVPLLNGIDHVERLRKGYGERVLPATIAVESEKVGPGRIRQPGPFAAITLAPPAGLAGDADRLAAELREAGFGVSSVASAAQALWTKLALLAPLALGTTSIQQPFGRVRDDSELFGLVTGCLRETCAVGAAESARLDPDALEAVLRNGIPDGMRTSMQKDLDAGRPIELDAIAGPIVRLGRKHGIPTPATEELYRRVAART